VAQRKSSDGDVEAKLAAIRKAVSHRSGGREVDIETMLAETEAGRLAEILSFDRGFDAVAGIKRLPGANPGD
jgi:hypothetical protein